MLTTRSPKRAAACVLAFALAGTAVACSDADTTTADVGGTATSASTDSASSDTSTSSDLTGETDALAERSSVVLAAGWSDNVTVTIVDEQFVFESDGLPSHEVLDQYLADGRDGKYLAGGASETPTRVEIPLVPVVTESPTQTSGGSIGVAISGAVFFNPYEGDGTGTVANDDNSTIDGVPFIDACGGHPLPNGQVYHYHGIPFCITDAIDTEGEHSRIIGYLFDGHAIYGPQDSSGEDPTDLDECMGHTGSTPEFDEDTYHYHVSSTANYISECLVGEYTAARR